MQLFRELIYNSFFCSALIVLAWAANKALGKWYQKTWRYYLWILIGLRLLIPFDFSLENAPIRLNAGEIIPVVTEGEAKMDRLPENTVTESEIWLLGCGGTFAYFFCAYWIQKRRIRRCSLPVMERQILSLWKKMLEMECISEDIPIYQCGLIHAPMVIGIRKKCLLFPEREFTSEELTYIFRHEIQHLKHHDIVVKLLYLGLCVVYWFQPAVWLMKHEMNRDLEAVCDSRVIRGFSADERYSYTQTMIRCMTQGRGLYVPVSSGFGGSVKIMKERIRLIMKGNKLKKGFGIYASLAVLMCAGMFLISCGTKAGKEGQESAEMRNEAQELTENKEELLDAGDVPKDPAEENAELRETMDENAEPEVELREETADDAAPEVELQEEMADDAAPEVELQEEMAETAVNEEQIQMENEKAWNEAESQMEMENEEPWSGSIDICE